MPILYYIYDYTLAGSFKLLYSELLSSSPTVTAGQMSAEILPTAVCLLYMVYTTAYHRQLRQMSQTELQNSLLDGQLKQAAAEMSTLSGEAERMGAHLALEASLPASLPIPDTALCALLSNGLENALNAAGKMTGDRRWVEFYCGVRLDKLLIEIRNPYAGRITFRDGLPETAQPDHGYGCLNIRTIAQLHRGLCDFKAEDGIFTLRVALPL